MLLPPASLHTCKQVCKQWHQFINTEIWGSKEMLKKLQERLRWQWEHEKPTMTRIQINYDIVDIKVRRGGFNHIGRNSLYFGLITFYS